MEIIPIVIPVDFYSLIVCTNWEHTIVELEQSLKAAKAVFEKEKQTVLTEIEKLKVKENAIISNEEKEQLQKEIDLVKSKL